jgi:hypothetical protein
MSAVWRMQHSSGCREDKDGPSVLPFLNCLQDFVKPSIYDRHKKILDIHVSVRHDTIYENDQQDATV